MPKVSVFTPSHRPEFLDACYASLARQTVDDWEWIVVLNSGATWAAPGDPRVHLHRADTLTGVGAVKRRACEFASGEILVEYDHDDVLASNALAEIIAAFEANPEVGFVYSDFAQITREGTRVARTSSRRTTGISVLADLPSSPGRGLRAGTVKATLREHGKRQRSPQPF